ncbi:hypothetical protein BDR05DRAFT_416154 [Suillus weaverae]|nr:hypothetical protein BDR05DRAFT_416154 [Suillus weaverae]
MYVLLRLMKFPHALPRTSRTVHRYPPWTVLDVRENYANTISISPNERIFASTPLLSKIGYSASTEPRNRSTHWNTTSPCRPCGIHDPFCGWKVPHHQLPRRPHIHIECSCYRQRT